jgi:hypothetical protein
MTADPVRQLAQANPVPNLTAQWTDHVMQARRLVGMLTSELRSIDDVQNSLGDHEIRVSVDLGPIGNAAAAARRDLEKQKPGTKFELPR